MRLLLDTHAFLWFFIGSPSLSVKARALIEDDSNEKFLSIGSLWEIAIKASIGKLTYLSRLMTYSRINSPTTE
jgi:PIN domain nuclease of toxin-antitoxin system